MPHDHDGPPAAVAAQPDLEWTPLLVMFGMTDAAIHEALRPGRGDQSVRLTLWHPAFAAFRAHPRFMELAEREGLPAYWQRFGPPDGCRLTADFAALQCAD